MGKTKSKELHRCIKRAIDELLLEQYFDELRAGLKAQPDIFSTIETGLQKMCASAFVSNKKRAKNSYPRRSGSAN